MDELNKHYETYKETYGDKAYKMQNSRETSRVRFLQEYISKYVPKGGKILDVGCGDMYLSTLMPGYNWVGIDIAPDMSDGKAIKHDLMTTPYPLEPQSFDAVVCSEVLEHLWDLRKVHAEVKRLIKTGGTYIVSTPNFHNIDHILDNFKDLIFNPSYTHLFEHIRFYTKDTHAVFLGESGFQVVDFTGCDSHYVRFLEEPRKVLSTILIEAFKMPIDQTTVDMIIGQMFPQNDHTILLVSKSI